MARSTGGAVSEGLVVLIATVVVLAGIGALVIWQAVSTPAPTPDGDAGRLARVEQRLVEADTLASELNQQLRDLQAELKTAEESSDATDDVRLEWKVRADLELDQARSTVDRLTVENERLRQRRDALMAENTGLQAPLDGRSDAAVVAGGGVGETWPLVESLPAGRDRNTVDSRLISNVRVVDANEGLDYVVLDVGKKHGVRPGMLFKLMDGEAVIGQLRARHIREEFTGAAVESLSAVPWWVRPFTADRFPAAGDRVILGRSENGKGL